MKIEDYQLLLDLNKCGTIRKTAVHVLISQPALTQRLKFMEEHLGGQIFLRTSKRLIPTSFGEIVLAHAEEVLKKESELGDKLAKVEGKITGTLSIGASSLYSQHFLPGLLQSFTKEYPDVTIDLVTGVSEEVRQSAAFYHISIVRGEPIKGYESLHLLSDPLFLFDSIPFGEKERPLIEFKSDTGFQKLMEQWMLRDSSILVKRSIKVDHFETAKQMMKRGLGMTVLPGSIISEEKNHFAWMPLETEGRAIVRETWACVKSEVKALPQVEAFLGHIKNEVGV
ncbi:DNA-binding transcriptional regulator, LysR family [Halobacillus karajensis]|uniref:HTH-type transcriptional regulator GltR n=1 Tax=Halobacillus karajensis TaxID=195088 RepID=A0A024P8R4_9BACI|nr:LysR family transcriptional regulator [Halobacillus karajensis]CDQ21589.1 HTH-type transcriptional regulator GltR [Halobacillus karajensis]CDQ25524.1 HTH-type transcriptional regulator GltR [Halobacillus karajensis]CDQ28946.1 HTH-type transcriptional regulator GltR [Halobacillus karajensis]SEI08709.1 DNA-binding transcriptional regulator, LysR family [Halobacillus karajensis]